MNGNEAYLRSLRLFAIRIIVQSKIVDADKILTFAKELGLIDENGGYTSLLTGQCNDEVDE